MSALLVLFPRGKSTDRPPAPKGGESKPSREAEAALRAADKTRSLSSPRQGRKASPSAVPPIFAPFGRALISDNGGEAVPLSRAAPGRTKRRAPGRLSAGDRPSLMLRRPAIFPFFAFRCFFYSIKFLFWQALSQKMRDDLSSIRSTTSATAPSVQWQTGSAPQARTSSMALAGAKA